MVDETCKHTVRVHTDTDTDAQCVGCGARVPILPEYQARYEIATGAIGSVIIRRIADNKSAFLQGDDATGFQADLAAMAETEYPYGPFKCYQEHLDYICSSFDPVME